MVAAPHPAPPTCPRCSVAPVPHFSAVSRRVLPDGSFGEVVAVLYVARCRDGNWVYRTVWSSPWGDDDP